MEYLGEKQRFLNLLVDNALSPSEAEKEVLATVPKTLKASWIRRFYAKQEELVLPKEPRLVNRYLIGADPEFFMVDTAGRYSHAEAHGLNTLTAFGCDLAGRQAELRVAPSRFIVESIASIVETLRWMVTAYPSTGETIWSSLPFLAGGPHGVDGAGGHVHLGRKNCVLEDQVGSLDGATKLCLHSGILSLELFNQRQKATVYGKWGDHRIQPFGFEYRTPPTWMSNPRTAYLVLVLHKLCSYHPTPLKVPESKGKAQQQVLNLLRLYRGLDDDAALALRSIQTLGWPVEESNDFKGRWGVEKLGPNRVGMAPGRYFYPPVIGAAEPTTQQVFDFLNGSTKEMPKAAGVVTWDMHEVPKGVKLISMSPHTKHLDNFCCGLMAFRWDCTFQASHTHNLTVQGPLDYFNLKELDKAFESLELKVTLTEHPKQMGIFIPIRFLQDEVRPEMRKQIRNILGNGKLLPLFKPDEWKDFDQSRWQTPPVKPEIATLGKKIADLQGEVQEKKPAEEGRQYKVRYIDGAGVIDDIPRGQNIIDRARQAVQQAGEPPIWRHRNVVVPAVPEPQPEGNGWVGFGFPENAPVQAEQQAQQARRPAVRVRRPNPWAGNAVPEEDF